MARIEKKAQVSVEYLLITVFALIIITAIFVFALTSSDQNIKARQISESLDNLTKTSDLVYAMGQNNVLFTQAFWPNEVKEIGIVYECRTAVELPGCGGGTVELVCGAEGTCCNPQACKCNLPGNCKTDLDCIKYSAIKVQTTLFGPNNEYLYPSRAKLCIQQNSEYFLAKGVKYGIKIGWTDTGMVELEAD